MSAYQIVTLSFLAIYLTADTPPAQAQQGVPESNLVRKSVKAVGYKVGGWSTKVDLKGTELMSQATGEAKVEAKQGKTNIEVSIKNLPQPTKLGTEFLTYVLWVVTPDGRTGNTGEILVNKNGEGNPQLQWLAGNGNLKMAWYPQINYGRPHRSATCSLISLPVNS